MEKYVDKVECSAIPWKPHRVCFLVIVVHNIYYEVFPLNNFLRYVADARKKGDNESDPWREQNLNYLTDFFVENKLYPGWFFTQ